MGKSKNILQKARKKYFKSLENKNETKNEELIKEEEEETKAERRMKSMNAVNEIRTKIFGYVRESGMPLCENLDIENVINYLQWLKS
jgi:hypothetical protein